jgi:hypothetical protein
VIFRSPTHKELITWAPHQAQEFYESQNEHNDLQLMETCLIVFDRQLDF